MNFETAIGAFASSETTPQGALEWVLEHWEEAGPACLALFKAYVDGSDVSERTERAMFLVVHLLGERKDARCFAPLCALLRDPERADLVFGDDALTLSVPSILISTFDGDPLPLHALVEDPQVDEFVRGDVLLVLAYLARTGSLPEPQVYDYLAALPDRLLPRTVAFVWFGWIRAVAALGFSGLAREAERLFKAGLVDSSIMLLEDFWQDLKDSREDPGGMSGRAWESIGPMGSTIDLLRAWESGPEDGFPDRPSEPMRNPLRDVGRNDPCPCGSGKKFKKCCLAA